jgi:hypothetical protein
MHKKEQYTRKSFNKLWKKAGEANTLQPPLVHGLKSINCPAGGNKFPKYIDFSSEGGNCLLHSASSPLSRRGSEIEDRTAAERPAIVI